LRDANIFERRQYFVHAPTFSRDANILRRRQYFPNPPIFLRGANILRRQYFLDLLDFVTADIYVYFQYLFCAFKYAPIFVGQLF
jgi:hypothetical protein